MKYKYMNKQTEKELLEIVSNNYCEIADLYSKSREKPLMPLWKELVDFAEQNIKPGNRILDVGCGNGRLNEAIIEKTIEYVGIDPCEGLLKHARELNPGRKFINGNILNLDENLETNFDYIFSIAVLHHIPGVDLRIKALQQLKNKLKPDGKIFLANWNLWNQKKRRDVIVKFAIQKILNKHKMDFGDILFDWKNNKQEKVSQRYYHAFTKCQLKKIAKKAGLKVERVYKDRFNYYLILVKK